VEEVPDDEEARFGGTLYTTLVGDPPQLDMMAGTQILMRFVSTHMVENLFTRDDEFQVIPELADTHEVSDDGLTNTVTLRQGVPFHNGDEMTARDVVACIERWTEISGMGGTWSESVDDIEQIDDYTIEVHMNTPLGTFAPMLANRMGGGCPIYPADLIEGVGSQPFNDVVSTGPYRLVEWVADTHVHMERFEDYASRDEEPRGYGGGKKQYLDEIYFIPVPDEASRIAGLQAGDYHFLDDISPDHLETFEDDPNIIAEPEPFTWMSLVLNTAEGVMSDVRMRQAVQACLNHEEILRAGYGDHFRLDPSLILQEMVWHTESGGELYDQRDPDRAQQLMEEAGYDGETITFLTTSEYTDRYNASMMAAQQMQDVGMNVETDVYDWATVGERRADPELWDLFYTSIGGIDPALTVFVASTTWPGWWDTDRKVDLAAQLREETDFDARYELFEELQQVFYEEVPVIKLGDIYQIYARSNRLQGFVPLIQQGSFLWNTWLEDS
jgi:peptide/nickel transport system substrate-binding protein